MIIIISFNKEDTSMAIKHSKQRDALVEILRSTKCHPTADWLYDKLREQFPKISLATVYRNLKQLEEAGEIISIKGGTDSEHYDGATHCHYHFICEECGSVKDMEVQPVTDLVDKCNEETNFEISGYSLLFYGKCEKCKK